LKNDWFRDFFTGTAVDFWMTAAPAPEDDVALLTAIFGAAPRTLLDIPCGGGRHAVALAQQGYDVVGVDISAEFLAIARDVATAAHVPLELHERDMRDLPWPARFDGAFCLGNSFGYLGRDGMQAFVAAVANSLRSGAALVLDTSMTAESLLPSLPDRREMQFGEILYRSVATYDVRESRLDVDYTFIRDGIAETKTAHTTVFTSGELCAMFERAGLRVEKLYASVKREPFRVGAPRLILIARKE
jgi:SAM-dependent methyltransferase